MRLDKYLHEVLNISRNQASKLIKTGDITVNGMIVKSGSVHVTETDQVVWNNEKLAAPLTGHVYFMLNKPADIVCTLDDPHHASINSLFDIAGAQNLHAAGRLDADTTGLVLVTTDGQWSHRVTAPKRKCTKVYQVTLEEPITPDMILQLEQGVMLHGEDKPTQPAELLVHDDYHIDLRIHEGRYHQVKRMMAAVGNHVQALHRSQIGPIALDANLAPGDYRLLTADEIAAF
jgi:16S rRNA pseudouridine516 synthase